MRVAGHRLRGGRCFRKGFARNAMVVFDEVFLFLNAGLQDLTPVQLCLEPPVITPLVVAVKINIIAPVGAIPSLTDDTDINTKES